jgi:hypothetical protein
MSLGQKAQTFEEQKSRTTKETVGFYHQTFLGQPKDSPNKKHKSSPTKKKEQAEMENFSQGTIWFQHHRIEFHQQTRSVSLANIVAGLDDDELTISP